MIWVRRVFRFYINASIHVALSVCALTYIALTKLDVDYDTSLLFFIFFSTILGYNFVKYVPLIWTNHFKCSRRIWPVFVLTCLSFFLTLYFSLKLELDVIKLIFLFGGLTFLYAFPSLKKIYYKTPELTLRLVPGLKIFVIAFVWAGVTVFLPATQHKISIGVAEILLAIQHFFIVVALMVPFEIRDLKYDDIALKTLPQLFGVKKTKRLGVFVCVIVFTLEFLKAETEVISLFLFLLILIGFILASRENQSKYYSSFWVEALPIFWLLLLVV